MRELPRTDGKTRRLEVMFIACCTTMFALIVGASLYLLVKLII